MTFLNFFSCFLLLLSPLTVFSTDTKISTPPSKAPTQRSTESNTTLETPTPPETQKKENSFEALYVSEVIDNGSFIILSDDSVWEVNPKDLSVATTWMFGADITLEETQDPDYNYLIKNIRSHSKIRVKASTQEELNSRLEKPSQSAPPQNVPSGDLDSEPESATPSE